MAGAEVVSDIADKSEQREIAKNVEKVFDNNKDSNNAYPMQVKVLMGIKKVVKII